MSINMLSIYRTHMIILSKLLKILFKLVCHEINESSEAEKRIYIYAFNLCVNAAMIIIKNECESFQDGISLFHYL